MNVYIRTYYVSCFGNYSIVRSSLLLLKNLAASRPTYCCKTALAWKNGPQKLSGAHPVISIGLCSQQDICDSGFRRVPEGAQEAKKSCTQFVSSLKQSRSDQLSCKGNLCANTSTLRTDVELNTEQLSRREISNQFNRRLLLQQQEQQCWCPLSRCIPPSMRAASFHCRHVPSKDIKKRCVSVSKYPVYREIERSLSYPASPEPPAKDSNGGEEEVLP